VTFLNWAPGEPNNNGDEDYAVLYKVSGPSPSQWNDQLGSEVFSGIIERVGAPPVFDCNSNGIPDDCEMDSDGDGVIDDCDGCPTDSNKTSPGICGCGVPDSDSDSDGVADCIDNCPTVANPDQNDCDGDGPGDACDDDDDNDGVSDLFDACPKTPYCSVDATGRPKLDMNDDCNVDGLDIQLIVNQLLNNCSQCP
jgi:hypothetical protein